MRIIHVFWKSTWFGLSVEAMPHATETMYVHTMPEINIMNVATCARVCTRVS